MVSMINLPPDGHLQPDSADQRAQQDSTQEMIVSNKGLFAYLDSSHQQNILIVK